MRIAPVKLITTALAFSVHANLFPKPPPIQEYVNAQNQISWTETCQAIFVDAPATKLIKQQLETWKREFNTVLEIQLTNERNMEKFMRTFKEAADITMKQGEIMNTYSAIQGYKIKTMLTNNFAVEKGRKPQLTLPQNAKYQQVLKFVNENTRLLSPPEMYTDRPKTVIANWNTKEDITEEQYKEIENYINATGEKVDALKERIQHKKEMKEMSERLANVEEYLRYPESGLQSPLWEEPQFEGFLRCHPPTRSCNGRHAPALKNPFTCSTFHAGTVENPLRHKQSHFPTAKCDGFHHKDNWDPRTCGNFAGAMFP
jgi:hypothetical protein